MVVEEYRTEEEQLEALGRWWRDNGRSTVVAVVVALAASFGWQAWKSSQQSQLELASDTYQELLRASGNPTRQQADKLVSGLAEKLVNDHGATTYAQFAALHLAAIAVRDNRLPEAEKQLRWVLGKAQKGSDVAQLAQVRLARVLAASGDTRQALVILQGAEAGPYGATYADAEGDVLLAAGRTDEARNAYQDALALVEAKGGRLSLQTLSQKLQSIAPLPARADKTGMVDESVDVVSEVDDLVDVPEE